jgi:type II secretory ATPase GspE/PulE/Tfp pilus assembly ATPase PilB-like protein
LAATVECIIAQRLVRRICPYCRRQSRPARAKIGCDTYDGAGCVYCNHTGYLGRTGVFEMFALSERIKEAVVRRESLSVIRKWAVTAGMTTLADAGMAKVRAGVTTYTEATRIAQSIK